MLFLQKAKIYRDVIHDTITTTKVATSIIDSKYFQRLRNLHQLGICYLVFPSANHTRFEHSIGTYHLVEKLIMNIMSNSEICELNKSLLKVPFIKNYVLTNFNLDETEENIKFILSTNSHLLDDYLIELIKIAGLCHDLGHGPLSHLFDEWLNTLEELRENPMIEHEERSISILRKLIDETEINDNEEIYKLSEFINDDAFEFIAELIHPKEDTPQNFVFQIVSNSLNGIDVDKLDYLCRDSFYLGLNTGFLFSRVINNVKVIDENICYPEKISYDILKIFRTRYDLHKQFYNHKTVICIEYMIRSILTRLDSILNIVKGVFNEKENNINIDEFCELSDSTIFNATTVIKQFTRNYTLFTISNETKRDIKYVDNILKKINKRELYKNVYFTIFPASKTMEDDKEKDVDLEDEVEKFLMRKPSIEKKEDLIPVLIKIGYLSGNKRHPFESIYFYNKDNVAGVLSKEQVSLLMSEVFQERLFFIIWKN